MNREEYKKMIKENPLGSKVLSFSGCVSLYSYLRNHEYDIANDLDDFGDLEGLFVEIIGRVPNEKRNKV